MFVIIIQFWFGKQIGRSLPAYGKTTEDMIVGIQFSNLYV